MTKVEILRINVSGFKSPFPHLPIPLLNSRSSPSLTPKEKLKCCLVKQEQIQVLNVGGNAEMVL